MAAQKNEERMVEVKARRNDDLAQISIADSGCGIPPNFREQVFKTSFSTTKDRGGLGLGLLIIDQLTNVIGGRVFLQADSPRTEFVLELPLGR